MNYISINDCTTSGGDYYFTFSDGWHYDFASENIMFGGDEHWINKDFYNDKDNFIKLNYIGSNVKLFGHKMESGALCDVYLDGERCGEIDYYAPERQWKALLFESQNVPFGIHELMVVIDKNGRKNPASGDAYECSCDRAEICIEENEIMPEAIIPECEKIRIEQGMNYRIACHIEPYYATIKPQTVYYSRDMLIASVNPDGVVNAKGQGETDIICKLAGYDISCSVKAECAKSKGSFMSVFSDADCHTSVHDYQMALNEAIEDYPIKGEYRAFRNDRVLIKADIFAKSSPLYGLTASVPSLKDAGGNEIPQDCIDVRFVTPTRDYERNVVVPDCINKKSPIDIPADTVQTMFVIADIPSDTKAGLYSGEIEIKCGADKQKLPFTVDVYPYTLDNVHDNKYQLELWEYPYCNERYYSGKTSEEYFGKSIDNYPFVHLSGKYEKALRSLLEIYRKGGGHTITVTCAEDPWNHQTHDPYPSMIKWYMHDNGEMDFDYTDFDYWVQLNLDCGIDRYIKTFSLSPWGNRVAYIKDDGSVGVECLEINTERWKLIWGKFLQSYMKHTTEKGWFDKVYISMDERPPQDIEAVLNLRDSIVREDGKTFKVSLAIFRWDAEYLLDRIDDLSMARYMDKDKLVALTNKRRSEGKLTTLYTCGPDCSALANPPYQSEYAILFGEARDSDGFLRWALDAFNADPIADSAHVIFAAGDLYLIYPDNVGCCEEAHTSHRFEKLAQGIRDVEKIHLLMREKPEFADELNALRHSFCPNDEDGRLEIKRVMDEVYRIARA